MVFVDYKQYNKKDNVIFPKRFKKKKILNAGTIYIGIIWVLVAFFFLELGYYTMIGFLTDK